MNKARTSRSAVARRLAARKSAAQRRCGATLVWFALMFIMLLGMVGLVIDSGLLLAARRQAQNAADAASTAAATDLLGGKSEDEARATATEFVKVHNGLTNAPDPVVNIPPASGPYQGEPGYVEVIVSNPLQTFLIHLLPGVSQENTVRARAVGGFEPITAGAGVAVLNPFVTGLTVGGQATLRVQGLVIVNSEGKGVDANNLPVGTGENYYAGRAGSNSPAYATKFHVVGGVDWPANFRNIDPASTAPALYCGQIPIPDPLLTLPTPVAGTGNGANTAGGVIDVPRGSPVATNTNLMPYDPLGVNKVLSPGSTGFETSLFAGLPYMVLHPGIYTSIEITGGNVLFKPGIFVIKPNPNTQTALKVTGGNVIAKGIMFYNTGHNYVAATGEPDVNDGDKKPPKWGGTDWDFAEFGTITINAGMEFSPIDLDDPVLYAEYQASGTIPDEMFNGMLFYQRRRDTVGLDIQGSSSEGMLSGTLYAKWAHVKLAGQGTYDAQFVVGSMEITGSGVVTIDYAGKKLGKAPQVFLVE